MSAANALTGISLVGSLVAGGQRSRHPEQHPRLHRGDLRDGQRRGRVPHHRPHAQDVQARRPEGAVTESSRCASSSSRAPTSSARSSSSSGSAASRARESSRGAWATPRWACCSPSWAPCSRRDRAVRLDRRRAADRAIIGVIIGRPLFISVPMTAMPQWVALSHAAGAVAATLVGVNEYLVLRPGDPRRDDGRVGI